MFDLYILTMYPLNIYNIKKKDIFVFFCLNSHQKLNSYYTIFINQLIRQKMLNYFKNGWHLLFDILS